MDTLPPTAYTATVMESLTASDTCSASVRANLSLSHLLSAALFSKSVKTIESANLGVPLGPFWEELQASSVGAVLVAVAALEAFANELFVDHATVFPMADSQLLKKLWERYERQPILDKLELAMLLRAKPAMDRSASPYQDVVALIKLRNALTHYKAEWSDEDAKHAKLSRALEHRAVSSPFFPATERLFPRAWASHGTVSWAVRSVTIFIVTFEQCAGLGSRSAPFLPQLNAL